MTCSGHYGRLRPSYRGAGEAARILLGIILVWSLSASAPRQVLSQKLESQPDAEIAGIKFLIPPDFSLVQSSNPRVAFMRHATSQTALFVAVPDCQVDGKYLTDLSNTLVSQLFPRQNGFAWKTLPNTSDRKMSVYQTSGGTTKGINATMYVQTDYLVVKAQGHEVVVGSIATYGEEREAKFLFEVQGREYSFLAWQALFQLIPSVTGERYDDAQGGIPALRNLHVAGGQQ